MGPMGPTWVLSATDGSNVGLMNLAIRDHIIPMYFSATWPGSTGPCSPPSVSMADGWHQYLVIYLGTYSCLGLSDVLQEGGWYRLQKGKFYYFHNNRNISNLYFFHIKSIKCHCNYLSFWICWCVKCLCKIFNEFFLYIKLKIQPLNA